MGNVWSVFPCAGFSATTSTTTTTTDRGSQPLLVMFPLLLLKVSAVVAEPWCYTDGVTCPTEELLGRTHGVMDALQCSTICDAQDLCTAFTLWGSTSLVHWEECWTFSTCVEEQACDECTTGKKSGDCSSTTRTTTSSSTTTSRETTVITDTTIPSNFCPALPQNGGSWICIPEVVAGEEVPEGADCIFSCGQGSSLHTCQGGEMSPPVPAGCYCPPIDLPPQGGLVCAPPLLESGEGEQGAVCIFSCDQHPQLEISCNEGSWDIDLDLLVC